jgi:hypothetical protein
MEDKRAAVADGLARWAAQEMQFRPEGKFAHIAPPSMNDMRSLCRGSALPFWDYVIHRVRSDKYVTGVSKARSKIRVTVGTDDCCL